MPDLDKVIAALECCDDHGDPDCDHCPYKRTNQIVIEVKRLSASCHEASEREFIMDKESLNELLKSAKSSKCILHTILFLKTMQGFIDMWKSTLSDP